MLWKMKPFNIKESKVRRELIGFNSPFEGGKGDVSVKLWNKFLTTFFFLIILPSCNQTQNPEKQSRVDSLPYYCEATFTPHWLSSNDNKNVLDTLHRISPFMLFNQEGDTVTENTFKDKIYVVDFFFTTCPGICPKMTDNMAILQEEFLEDSEILLASHSVTPKYDSIAVLKEYAELKGIRSEKWHLLTGEREQIYKLGRKDYFVEEDLGLQKDVDDFLHTENFVLIDKNRHIRGIYNGLNKVSVNQLIADIWTLKKE